MPRTALAVQRATSAGTQLTFNPVTSASDAVLPAKGRVLLVQNASASPVTVTIPSVKSVDNLVVPDRTITVTNGTTKAIAIGEHPLVGVEADALVYLNYSATATVTAAYVETL